jgi:hypothetical protein
MEKGSEKTIADTVRKLKTEQANVGGTTSLTNSEDDETKRPSGNKKLVRPQNIFKRF